MRCSPILLSRPRFWQNSVSELKRLTKFAVNLEGLSRPKTQWDLINFAKPESVELCKSMSDMDIGGFSTATLDHVPASDRAPGHMRFHGSISTQLPVGRPDVQRTGYAGWRTHDRGWTLFGKRMWDVDDYRFIALRVKSDGRKYFLNLQADTIVPTDLHQHRLYTRTPGEWETVLISFQDFVRTNYGMVVEPQSELLKQKVTSIGISSTDRMTGPYDLSIGRIWATNMLSEAEQREQEESKKYTLGDVGRKTPALGTEQEGSNQPPIERPSS